MISTDDHILKRLKGLVIKRPGLVLGIWGEAGIGKTYTVQKLLHETVCQHLSLHATIKLSNLARALPKPKTLPVWATRILEKLEHDEVLTIEQSISVFGAVLSSIAPFVLYLEDLHEANSERVEWVQALANTVKHFNGVALIVTSRTAPPEPFETIRLETLELEQVKQLLESEASAALPLEAIEWIHGKAAGNPLFTLEFFKYLARLGFVWNDGKKWHWREPKTETTPVMVEALIEQQLSNAAITNQLQTVLEVKAILATSSSNQLLAAIANLPQEEVRQALSELEQRGVLVGTEFRHPLYREVILKKLNDQQRQGYARRAIAYLEVEQPELAVDFLVNAKLEPEAALDLFDRGIQKLRSTNYEVEAAYLISRSLYLRIGEERTQFALTALNVLTQLDFKLASHLLEIAKQTTSTHEPTLLNLAQQIAQRGNAQGALDLLERLRQKPPLGLTWFEMQALVYSHAGNNQKVATLIAEEPKLLFSQSSEVLKALIFVLAITDAPKALEVGLQGLELPNLTALQRANLLEVVAVACFYQGQLDNAIEYWSQSIELFTLEKMQPLTLKATINRANALLRKDDKKQAVQDLEHVSNLAQQYGDQRIYSQSLALLGATLSQLGEFERAEEILLEALSMVRHFKADTVLMNTEFALAELYRVWDSPHQKLLMYKYAHQGLKHATQLNMTSFILSGIIIVSSAECLIGNAKQALEQANLAFEKAIQHNSIFLITMAQICQANALKALGESNQALELYKKIVTSAQTQGLKVHAQENQLEIEFLTNNLQAARKLLEWFESNGHPLEATKARQYFSALNPSEPPVTTEARVTLQLEVLGTLQIKLDGKPQTIRGRKRQELLALLLEARIAGRSEVNRLELLDVLYPDEIEDRATSSLKEMVRGTRSSLTADVIETTTNGYALGNITSDAEEFLKTGDSSFWRDVYLQGIILEHGFDSVRESLSLALFNAAKMQLESNPKEAARVSRILLEMDSYNLEYLRLCVQALRSSGNHKSLTREYSVARKRLLEVGEVLPERWQDFTDPQSAKTA